MDLHKLADVSQIVATLTIIGGTIFALVQLSEMKKQRRDLVAGELMRAFLDADFANALAVVRALPDGMSAEDLLRAGPETERAAVHICTSFETMGLLVHERIAPFPLVLELTGGIVVVCWHKLGPWLEYVRVQEGQPTWAEWFQWLAQQCEKHKQIDAPAYARYSSWTP